MFSISYQSIRNFMCFVFRDEGNEQMILYEIGLVSNQYVRGNQTLYAYQATCYSCIVSHIDILKCKFPTLKLSTHTHRTTHLHRHTGVFLFLRRCVRGSRGIFANWQLLPSPDYRNGFVWERGQNMIAVTCITVGKYLHIISLPYDMKSNKCTGSSYRLLHVWSAR